MTHSRRETGRLGEELARGFLEKQGYCVLETNYRCPEGEIDIVAEHQNCLVFVEVRTKTSQEFGSPEESITKTKKARLIAAALSYLQGHKRPETESLRIDFVAVELDQRGRPSRIELIKNAISES